jgi:hypothetical protein
MGSNVYAGYNPANSLTIDEDERIENENGDEINAAAREGRRQQIGLANACNANCPECIGTTKSLARGQ